MRMRATVVIFSTIIGRKIFSPRDSNHISLTGTSARKITPSDNVPGCPLNHLINLYHLPLSTT